MTLKAVPSPTPSSSLEELLDIMARLRHPVTGSAWEKEQTNRSLAPNLIEESYETLDAILRDDMNELRGELGDLLLQVVFHSQIAKEQGHFSFDEVVDTLVAKIKMRLPAFFSGTAVDMEEQLRKWEAVKVEERKAKGYTSALDGIAPTLPALMMSSKLQDRAARAGFKWPDLEGHIAKVEEEWAEVKEALRENDKAHIEEELGDLLMAVSNLARIKDIDAETALHRTNKKFSFRFRFIEKALNAQGKSLKDTPLAEMMQHWRAAKAEERQAAATKRC